MARRRLTPAQPGYHGPATGEATGSGASQTRPASGRAIPPIAQVSGQSAEAAALREITEGLQAARDEGRMVVDVPLADLAPGHLMRDRITLDRDELESLKASIRDHGQRTPAEITPLSATSSPEGMPPYRFGLISGWRRLRALSELYDETGELRFSMLRALIRPSEDAAASYVAMVEENEIRVGLSYYERGRVVAEATARGVFEDQSLALRTLFSTASRAKRSKIGSFVGIHEALGDLLHFPADIPERLGLALAARLHSGDKARIRKALRDSNVASSEAELALLTRLANSPRPNVSHAKHSDEVLRDGVTLNAVRKGNRITLTLTGTGVDDSLLDKLRAAVRGLD